MNAVDGAVVCEGQVHPHHDRTTSDALVAC